MHSIFRPLLVFAVIFTATIFLFDGCQENENTPVQSGPTTSAKADFQAPQKLSDVKLPAILSSDEVKTSMNSGGTIPELPKERANIYNKFSSPEAVTCKYYDWYVWQYWNPIYSYDDLTLSGVYGYYGYWFYTNGGQINLPTGASSINLTRWECGWYNTASFYDENGYWIYTLPYETGGCYTNTGLSYTAPSGRLIKTIVLHGSGYWGPFNICYGSPNQPPTANAGADQTAECTNGSAGVTLNGSASSDPDGNALTYSWTLNGNPLATGVTPAVTLPLGSNVVTLTVDDGNGGSASDNVSINVVDTAPPTLNFSLSQTQLWPPNHSMQLVATNISGSDVCCDVTTVVNVTSNEPIDGLGDGDMSPDWLIIDNGYGGFDVFVRAERSGTGNGRVYTITATATDCAGNSSSSTKTVTVPKSRGRN